MKQIYLQNEETLHNYILAIMRAGTKTVKLSL